MAIKTFTTGEVLTASDTNTYLANAGLVYVTAVDLSGSSVSINNCFTSTYTNYRIMFSNVGLTSANAVYMRLRVGGVDSQVQYYYAGLYRLFTGGGGDQPGNNLTLYYVCTPSNNDPAAVAMDVFNPAAARTTQFTQLNANFDAGAYQGGAHKVSTAYDGFTVIAATGTTFNAGRVSVFGYRQA